MKSKGNAGEGLWPDGSYWHLQTRKDEFDAMRDGQLKEAASLLDQRLSKSSWKTLIHGDAKVANIGFADNDEDVALVDFQYTGRGCGLRDVVYFLGGCLTEKQCIHHAEELLNVYFVELECYLPDCLRSSVEEEWRGLYATAWADFHRFLAGWKPNHHKVNRYMLTMTERALSEL